MDVSHIKMFVCAYEAGSFTAAAKQAGCSLQNAAITVARLEKGLNQILFERSRRGVSPTPFGVKFYQKSVPFLKAFADCEAFIDAYECDEEKAGDLSA